MCSCIYRSCSLPLSRSLSIEVRAFVPIARTRALRVLLVIATMEPKNEDNSDKVMHDAKTNEIKCKVEPEDTEVNTRDIDMPDDTGDVATLPKSESSDQSTGEVPRFHAHTDWMSREPAGGFYNVQPSVEVRAGTSAQATDQRYTALMRPKSDGYYVPYSFYCPIKGHVVFNMYVESFSETEISGMFNIDYRAFFSDYETDIEEKDRYHNMEPVMFTLRNKNDIKEFFSYLISHYDLTESYMLLNLRASVRLIYDVLRRFGSKRYVLKVIRALLRNDSNTLLEMNQYKVTVDTSSDDSDVELYGL